MIAALTRTHLTPHTKALTHSLCPTLVNCNELKGISVCLLYVAFIIHDSLSWGAGGVTSQSRGFPGLQSKCGK